VFGIKINPAKTNKKASWRGMSMDHIVDAYLDEISQIF